MKHTPLYDLHLKYGAKMVEFAEYDMPVQYDGMGVMKEHLHTREYAGLFDVSHMGQILLKAKDDPATHLEKICPSDIVGLKAGQSRYTVLLNENGGITDDMIVGRVDDNTLSLVLNASRKAADIKLIKTKIGDHVTLEPLKKLALIALQGPKAQEILEPLCPDFDLSSLSFMSFSKCRLHDANVTISRSGYTGEDGFEISVPASHVVQMVDLLLEHEDVALVGLGARNSLRLEAGLCLYGQDLTHETTPIEADLKWIIPKERRENGGFLGFDIISKQLTGGVKQVRIGLQPDGRAPIREGDALVDDEGSVIGQITSGCFGPSVQHPIAMAYILNEFSDVGTSIKALVRGKEISCNVVKLPFVQQNYKRAT